MIKPIYLVCGVSGCGKSWACRQVADKFTYIPHDRCWTHPTATPDQGLDPTWAPGAISNHFETLQAAAHVASKPILTECPFAERELRDRLEAAGVPVIPIFVVEPTEVVKFRYANREGKPLPRAAETRSKTILKRAQEWGAFYGTSDEVKNYLEELAC